jgi:acetyl/propionyl-CoA carboxylase alpha subunit
MGETAVRIAHAAGYTGAGTVEFLVDEHQHFYFLEMNTRIQVEHPVTEMITGIDMVREQINIAGGHPLPWSQKDIPMRGHAIEARIYAENPEQDFMPSPGKIEHFIAPVGNRIRTDTGIRSQDEISASYDPMVAKIIAHGNNRTEAAGRLRSALLKMVITGIRNNLRYLHEILAHPQYLKNELNTHFIANHHDQLLEKISRENADTNPAPLLAGYIFHHSIPAKKEFSEQAWQEIGYWRNYMKWTIILNQRPYECRFTRNGYTLHLSIPDQEPVTFRFSYNKDGGLRISSDREHQILYFAHRGEESWITADGLTHRARHNSYLDTLANKKLMEQTIRHNGEINSPMHGKVLSIEVNEEMSVRKGQTLVVLEAMKMENNIQAPHDTRVKHIAVKEGEQVSDGQLLLETYNN